MFEPRIVCFFCKWCTYAGADLAGTSRKQYPPNGVVVRLNCSGRLDPQHVLWAFREGADGVLIGGCHPGDCHYQDGNYKTMRRAAFLKRVLSDMGIEPERLHLEWISAAEGDKLVNIMGEFVDRVRDLGPLELAHAGGRGNGGAKPADKPAATKKTAAAPESAKGAEKPAARKS
jgi:F420-non-reducing hydrogenase iron-sulfur subunit